MKNKETLEEAADDKYPLEIWTGEESIIRKLAFINGAKWQQERSYTLDQIDELFFNEDSYILEEFLLYRVGLKENTPNKISFKEWFEQFKNKRNGL